MSFSSEDLGNIGSMEEFGGGQGKGTASSGSEHADSASAGGSLAQAPALGGWVGGWVSGEEAGRAPRRVGSCNCASELGRPTESLNLGSGSLS